MYVRAVQHMIHINNKSNNSERRIHIRSRVCANSVLVCERPRIIDAKATCDLTTCLKLLALRSLLTDFPGMKRRFFALVWTLDARTKPVYAGKYAHTHAQV